MINIASTMQAQRGFLFPFAIRTASDAYDNSSNIAQMMNLGSPKGIPITPIIMMETNTINT